MWVRTESGLWDDLQSAAVKVTHAFYDKRISLSAFEIARETMRKEYEGLAKKLVPKANEMAESFSRKATSLAETNINVSVDDMRFLPPYLEGRDRICFTVIRKERNDIGGEKSVSFSVTTCAMLWIRGTAFNLYVNDGVVEKESDLDAAVSATRDKLKQRIAEVEDHASEERLRMIVRFLRSVRSNPNEADHRGWRKEKETEPCLQSYLKA